MADAVALLAETPPADLLPVGRITDAYGIKGWLRLEPFSPEATALLNTSRWWLQRPGQTLSLRLRQQIRWQGKNLVANLQDVLDRDQAESLKGCQVLVSRQDFPDLAPDEYYWTDLIGCEVVNQNQTGLGQVVNVIENGAHAILEVRNEAEQTEWLPFVAAHIDRVDLASRRIEVNWLTPY